MVKFRKPTKKKVGGQTVISSGVVDKRTDKWRRKKRRKKTKPWSFRTHCYVWGSVLLIFAFIKFFPEQAKSFIVFILKMILMVIELFQ